MIKKWWFSSAFRLKLPFAHGKLYTNFGKFNFFSEGGREVCKFTD